MIHFITVGLVSQVHAQALGFTSTVYLFVWAVSSEAAKRLATHYLEGSGIAVRKVLSAALAVQQSPARYTFPEQIHGLPATHLSEALRGRQYSDEMLQDALRAHARSRAAITAGSLQKAPCEETILSS